MVDVVSQAIGSIIIDQCREGRNVDSRWTLLKEKVAQLKAADKKEIIGVLEGIVSPLVERFWSGIRRDLKAFEGGLLNAATRRQS